MLLEIRKEGNLTNVVQKPEHLLENDKEKYREMILDAAERVLSIFGFDRIVYGNPRKNNKGSNNRRWSWWQELREERTKDIETEI